MFVPLRAAFTESLGVEYATTGILMLALVADLPLESVTVILTLQVATVFAPQLYVPTLPLIVVSSEVEYPVLLKLSLIDFTVAPIFGLAVPVKLSLLFPSITPVTLDAPTSVYEGVPMV